MCGGGCGGGSGVAGAVGDEVIVLFHVGNIDLLHCSLVYLDFLGKELCEFKFLFHLNIQYLCLPNPQPNRDV